MNEETYIVEVEKNAPTFTKNLNLIRFQSEAGNPEIMYAKQFTSDVVFVVETESVRCIVSSKNGKVLFNGSTYSDYYGFCTSYSEPVDSILEQFEIEQNDIIKAVYHTKLIIHHYYPTNAPDTDYHKKFRTIPARTIVDDSKIAQCYWDMEFDEKMKHADKIKFLHEPHMIKVIHDGKEFNSDYFMQLAKDYINRF